MTSRNFRVKLSPSSLSHLVTILLPLPKLRHKITPLFKKAVLIACRNKSDFSFLNPMSA